MSEKLRVGVLDITGCNGCVLSVAFNEDEVLDIFNLVDVVEYRFVSDPAGGEAGIRRRVSWRGWSLRRVTWSS